MNNIAVSPSKLSAFNDDPLFYYFRYERDLPRPSVPALNLGSFAHQCLERLNRNPGLLKSETFRKRYGEVLPYLEGYFIQSLSDFETNKIAAEVPFNYILPIGDLQTPTKFLGFVDYVQTPYVISSHSSRKTLCNTRAVFIKDYKFLASYKKVNPGEDPQLRTYMCYLAIHYGMRRFKLCQVQFNKKKPGEYRDIQSEELHITKEEALAELEFRYGKLVTHQLLDYDTRIKGLKSRIKIQTFSFLCKMLGYSNVRAFNRKSEQKYRIFFRVLKEILGRVPTSDEINIAYENNLTKKLKKCILNYIRTGSISPTTKKQIKKDLQMAIDFNNIKAVSVTTPEVSVVFRNVTAPHKFSEGDKGKFGMTVLLRADNEEHTKFISQVSKAVEDFETEYKKAGGKKSFNTGNIFKESTDQDGNITGDLLLTARSAFKPFVADITGSPTELTQEPATGTVVKVRLKLKIYETPQGAGVTKYLQGIQIINENNPMAGVFLDESGGDSGPINDL